jgi:glyoxylase-like metal-dependent hydrolase (beta-lactamase superfamily II)
MRPTIVNVYLIRAGDRWTLVDTGMNTEDAASPRSAARSREIGIAPAAITAWSGRTITSTTSTSGPYRELTHAEVFLHPLEAERATMMVHISGENTEYLSRHGVPDVPPDKRLPPPSRFFGSWYAPAAPDHLLADEDEIPLGDGRALHVVWTPGHTAGHCCLLLEPDGVLFVGDHLLPKITPHVGLCRTAPRTRSATSSPPTRRSSASMHVSSARRTAPSTRTTAGALAS